MIGIYYMIVIIFIFSNIKFTISILMLKENQEKCKKKHEYWWNSYNIICPLPLIRHKCSIYLVDFFYDGCVLFMFQNYISVLT